MRTNTNTSRIAMACLVLGTVGAIFHTGSPQAAAISPARQVKKADMCVVAASFEADASSRRVATAMRDAYGCSPRRS